MFLIHCPHCDESREEEEFHASGQAHIARPADPDACSDTEWGEYLYFRDNPKGLHRELWVHAAGCRKYFNVLRDTATYRILGTYRCGESFDPDSADAVDAGSVDHGHAISARTPRRHAATGPDDDKHARHSKHSAGQGVDKLVSSSKKSTKKTSGREEN